MITNENKLHNIQLIKKIVENVFIEIKDKYQFIDFLDISSNNLSDNIYLGITKNHLIIYAHISTREAVELLVLEEGKEKWDAISLQSLIYEIFPPLSEESKLYLREKNKKLSSLAKYSIEYYESMIKLDILFLEKYFPQILREGVV